MNRTSLCDPGGLVFVPGVVLELQKVGWPENVILDMLVICSTATEKQEILLLISTQM